MSQKLIEKILSNSASGLEHDQFKIWLGESKDNQLYFEQVKAIWTRMDGVYTKTDFDLKLARLKVQSKIRGKKPMVLKTNWYYRIAVAASIVVLLAVGFLVINQSNKNSYKEFTSGEVIKNIELKDGSHVWLNKNSTFKLPENFSRNSRTVYLKGEAYFEVKSDETKPFKVIAGKTVTKVLGTSFNIKMDTLLNNVLVVVNTGKVAFYETRHKKEGVVLLAGETAGFNALIQEINKTVNANLNYLAWKTHVLTFQKTPLKEVCNVLSGYYKKPVTTDLIDANYVITGTFEQETLDDILATIQLTLDVQVKADANHITICK